MAKVPNLSAKQRAFYDCINWLELVYDGEVLVLDVDHDGGNIQLVGVADETTRFKNELGDMLMGITDPYEEWRRA